MPNKGVINHEKAKKIKSYYRIVEGLKLGENVGEIKKGKEGNIRFKKKKKKKNEN